MFQHLEMMEKDLLNRLQADRGEFGNQKLYSPSMLTGLEPEKKKILERTRALR